MIIPKFVIPLLVGGIIQFLKLIIDYYTKRKLTFASLWSAGGFPSVHSGIAASMATIMLIEYGINSAEFAISFVFGFLFWYDAANVRFEAGQHATFLNKINEELERTLNLGSKMTFLKERLGHTGFEVVGGIIVGVSLTLLGYLAMSCVDRIPMLEKHISF